MAIVQLFAWKLSDFLTPEGAPLGQAVWPGQCQAVLAQNAEPIPLGIEDGDNAPDMVGAPVLATDLEIGTTIYPAGAVVIAASALEVVSHPPVRLIFAHIGNRNAAGRKPGDMLVFATAKLTPCQMLEMCKPTIETGQTSNTVNFARGTLIETPHGALPIERLEQGDEVFTRDGGIQLISHIRHQRFSGLELLVHPHLRPVRIRTGALVGGLPGEDLIVAQQHGLLLDDWRAAYLFGEDAIMVPASSLVNGSSVTVECPISGVEYFQIGLEQRDLIAANGLWAETGVPDLSQFRKNPQAKSGRERLEEIRFTAYISDGYNASLPALLDRDQASLAA